MRPPLQRLRLECPLGQRSVQLGTYISKQMEARQNPVSRLLGWATTGTHMESWTHYRYTTALVGPPRLSALVARDLDGNRRKVSKVDTKCMCVKQRLLAAWAAGEMGWYP